MAKIPFHTLAVLLIAFARLGIALNCWDCAGDNCHNVQSGLAKFVNCSTDNDLCYTGVGLMNGGTVYARGCGTLKTCEPAGIPWFHSNGVELKDCSLCYQDSCNSQADAPIECYTCYGSIDVQCNDDNLKITSCPQGTCATFEGLWNGSPIMYKECAQFIEHYCEKETQILENLGNEIDNCALCNTPFCNIGKPEPGHFSCYSCGGDESVCNKTSSMHKSVCSEDKPFCFSGLGVKKNGEVIYVRECAQDEGVCPGALSFIEEEGGIIVNCTVCDSHLCNDASKTPEEFSCYSCHGNANENICHDSNKMKKRMCLNGERYCMSAEGHLSPGVVNVYRDCSLDETSCNILNQESEVTNCTICDSHLCNGAIKHPLECYECAGEYNECYNPSMMLKKQCGPNDYVCVTAEGFIEDTETLVVGRGCSPDKPMCIDAISSIVQLGVKQYSCFPCEDNLCNFPKEQPMKCYDCVGTISDCHNSETMRETSCPQSLCYAGEGELNGFKMYARGCADKETFCEDGISLIELAGGTVINCTVCHTELCNGAVCTDDRCKSLASSTSLMPLILLSIFICASFIST